MADSDVADRAMVFTTCRLAGSRPNLLSNVARSWRISMEGGLLASSGMTTVSLLPSIPRLSSGATP